MRLRGSGTPGVSARFIAGCGVLALGLLGCAQILGLEEWPPESAGGQGASGTGAGGTSAGGDMGLGGTGSGGTGVGGAGGSAATGTDATGQGGAGGQGTCADGVRNGLETSIDCGGDSCPPCPDGAACENDADCIHGACSAEQVCVVAEPSCMPEGPDPICSDCVQNGDETAVDCGGVTCLPCGSQRSCAWDGDCLSSQCISGLCQKGGAGTPCLEAADCGSGACQPGGCWVGYCCQ